MIQVSACLVLACISLDQLLQIVVAAETCDSALNSTARATGQLTANDTG